MSTLVEMIRKMVSDENEDFAACVQEGGSPEMLHPIFREALKAADELERITAELGKLQGYLSFIERWANHHPQHPRTSAQEALSVIQHYPPIKAITLSYADGVVPDTPDPWAERDKAVAERDALRSALDDLMSWFPEAPTPPHWRLKGGEHGADAAVIAAREVLNAAREPSHEG